MYKMSGKVKKFESYSLNAAWEIEIKIIAVSTKVYVGLRALYWQSEALMFSMFDICITIQNSGNKLKEKQNKSETKQRLYVVIII